MIALMSEEWSFPYAEASLSARWDAALHPVAVAVLAHGAGAGMDHPFMAGAAAGLAEGEVSAMRFNFPYAEARRRSPDRPAVALAAWRAALAGASERAGPVPLVAGGKSFGGRMASMLAAEDGERFPARALVFFGYPLHAPGRSDQPRDAHLPDVRVPMLFIQGTQDALATFPLVQRLVERLGSRARLHAVEGADHSFRVRGRRRPDVEIARELGGVAAAFVREVTG